MSEEVKAEPLDDDDEPVTSSAADAPEAQRPVTRVDAISPELLALLRKVVPPVWLAAAIIAGITSGVELAFLVAAAGVLTLVITVMWSSVQSLTGGSSLRFEEALGMGAPSKVEEEKRAVLRALKDLEYERGVGKITPEDYAELVAKYRAEAKRLMQSVDEKLGPAREQVEKQIAQRLGRASSNEAPSVEERAPVPEAMPSRDGDAEPAEPALHADEPAVSQPAPPEEKP